MINYEDMIKIWGNLGYREKVVYHSCLGIADIPNWKNQVPCIYAEGISTISPEESSEAHGIRGGNILWSICYVLSIHSFF